MSKILFTEKDIEKQKQNKHVKRVSEKYKNYTFEFIRLFIDKYMYKCKVNVVTF